MLRVHRHAFACLEADESEALRLDDENRAWRAKFREDLAARNALKHVKVTDESRLRKKAIKQKKAAEEARMMGRGRRQCIIIYLHVFGLN
jgi:hypothetical protein